jgi:hypothetical protein
MTNFYIVTPTKTLNSFISGADRAYFSNPILVELLYTELSTKLIYVRDPHRGHTYPTLSSNLISHWRLTRRQREAVN